MKVKIKRLSDKAVIPAYAKEEVINKTYSERVVKINEKELVVRVFLSSRA